MSQKIKEGIYGEVSAKEYLVDKGYVVIGENVKCERLGELDLVCMDRDVLVFVEVKARRNQNYGHPLEAITQAKMHKLVKAAGYYLSHNPNLRYVEIRFDVVAILGDQIEHIKSAFYGKWYK